MNLRLFMSVILIMAFCTQMVVGQTPDLKPDVTQCQLNIVVANMNEDPRVGEQIIITALGIDETFKGYTDKNGSVSFLVPQGHTYHLSFRTFDEKTDYTELEIPNVDGPMIYDFKMNFEMTKRVYRLRNVFFDTGKATLRPESFAALGELVDIMEHKSTMVIEIVGHTDNVGEPDDNMSLSQNRADAVMNYLIKEGIGEDRLQAVGYGETKSVADNDTPEGRQKNRRTEIRVLKE